MHCRIWEPIKTLAGVIFFSERPKPFLNGLMPPLNPTKNKKGRTPRHTKGEAHRAQAQLTACTGIYRKIDKTVKMHINSH